MCVRVCVCRVSEGLFQIAQNVLSADEELLLGNRARDRMGKTEREEGAENCGSWRKEWEKELEGGGGAWAMMKMTCMRRSKWKASSWIFKTEVAIVGLQRSRQGDGEV